MCRIGCLIGNGENENGYAMLMLMFRFEKLRFWHENLYDLSSGRIGCLCTFIPSGEQQIV